MSNPLTERVGFFRVDHTDLVRNSYQAEVWDVTDPTLPRFLARFRSKNVDTVELLLRATTSALKQAGWKWA